MPIGNVVRIVHEARNRLLALTAFLDEVEADLPSEQLVHLDMALSDLGALGAHLGLLAEACDKCPTVREAERLLGPNFDQPPSKRDTDA